MAFGLDDAFSAATGAIKLADTIAQITERYRKEGKDLEIEKLLAETRTQTIEKLDGADRALLAIEQMLRDRKISFDQHIIDVIEKTSPWRVVERARLKKAQNFLNEMQRSLYSAIDDVAALAQCRDNERPFGEGVAMSSKDKLAFHEKIVVAKSIGESFELLRSQIAALKKRLQV